jgi:predicted N-acyltransferase
MWKDNNIHLISDRDLRNAIENYVKTEDIKNENNNRNIENAKALP